MSIGSNRDRMRALTLMELLISLVLFSMIVLGISNIEMFCKRAFMGADRKTRVTGEATYIVEHMSKYIGQAVGHALDFPVSNSVPIAGCDVLTRVWIDSNQTGVKDNGDCQIVYCFNSTSHTFRFYPNYLTLPDMVTNNTTNEILSRNMLSYNATFGTNMTYVDLNITTCWNASIPGVGVDNPRVTMQTRIVMQSVSINATP